MQDLQGEFQDEEIESSQVATSPKLAGFVQGIRGSIVKDHSGSIPQQNGSA